MPDVAQIDIPERASEKDRQRIEQVNRNIRIRGRYDDLLEKMPWEHAMKQIAREESVSFSLVREVLKGRR